MKGKRDIYEKLFEEEVGFSQENTYAIYPAENISPEKGFYSIFELKRKFDFEEKKIILASFFQRDYVWNNKLGSDLVESVLMGLPIPIFYFNQDKFGRLIVIDGRQRLTALFNYLDNKYKLINPPILTSLNGMYFKDLPTILQTALEDYQILAHIIPSNIPDRVKFDIFERVNRSSTTLNKQEIRNALYQGKSTTLLKEITDSAIFKEATGNTFSERSRMKDKYIVLRFIAIMELYFTDSINKVFPNYIYKGDMDDLLGKTMEILNVMSDSEIEQIKHTVLTALDRSYHYMGENAFRLSKGPRKSPINMNIFEMVLYSMLYLPKNTKNLKEVLPGKFENLIKSSKFKNNVGDHRDSPSKILDRLEMGKSIMGGKND